MTEDINGPEKVKAFREYLEITQKQLAVFLGYKDYTTVQKWEVGAIKVPISVLVLIKLLTKLKKDTALKFILEEIKQNGIK